MPDYEIEKANDVEVNDEVDDDDWHSSAERQVMNKMEKWREKYDYKRSEEVIEASRDIVEKDILSILEAKERDLILAAELGKSLLEKNEELSKHNEQIAEDFSQKLEILEQEKYQLKRQLQIAEEEYDQRICDLQADIVQLKETIDKHSIHHKKSERHSSQLVTDLTEQNQRLTSQLRMAGENEKELRNHINQMKTQFNVRRTSIQEHFGFVESLREEISSVMGKKDELEKQIKLMSAEQENLTQTLEQSSDTIRQLERKQKDQNHLVRSKEKDIEELRAGNNVLLERLETMSRSRSSSPSCRMSLLSEMEMSGSDGEKSFYPRQFDVIDETDEEFDLEEMESSDCEMACDVDLEIKEFRKEVLSAYQQLRNLSILLRQREQKTRTNYAESMETSSSGSSVEIVSVKVGQLDQAVVELKTLLHHLLRKESRCGSSSLGCLTCGRSLEERQNLEKELHQTLEQMERGKIGIKRAELEAKQKEEEIQRIKSKLVLLEARLTATDEERLIMRKDVEESSLSKETLIKSAWSSRDAAVSRKNVAEVELARGRIEVMQVSSQLMEAVQQKVSLSQQLEEWEVDLQIMLQEQVKDKLGNSSQSEKSSSRDSGKETVARKVSRPSSIMSFFSR